MGNKIKAVFFDLDGTLVNTLESLKKTMNDTMEHYSLEGVSLEETKKFVGTGSKKFVERTLEKNAQVWYDKAEKWEEKDEEKAMDLDLKGDAQFFRKIVLIKWRRIRGLFPVWTI